MKNIIFISLSSLLLAACGVPPIYDSNEDLHDSEVADTQYITDKEQHLLEMEADQANGYANEK